MAALVPGGAPGLLAVASSIGLPPGLEPPPGLAPQAPPGLSLNPPVVKPTDVPGGDALLQQHMQLLVHAVQLRLTAQAHFEQQLQQQQQLQRQQLLQLQQQLQLKQLQLQLQLQGAGHVLPPGSFPPTAHNEKYQHPMLSEYQKETAEKDADDQEELDSTVYGEGGESEELHEADSDEHCDLSSTPRMLTGDVPMTSLMVRNIPVMYTQEMLMEEWPNTNNMYDFLYLPYSCASQRNLTYAFINFTSEAAAVAFKDKWQKKRLAHFTARKPLNISFADVQGRDNNLLQLKKKRVRRIKVQQCQPILFDGNKRVPLAQALAALEQKMDSANQKATSCDGF